jgi:hypothetical protein
MDLTSDDDEVGRSNTVIFVTRSRPSKSETKSVESRVPTPYSAAHRHISPALVHEAPPCSQSQAYFKQFPDFPFNSSQPSMPQLFQLHKQEGWSDDRLAREKKRLSEAYIADFECFYGSNANDIETWRALYRALGIDPAPDEIWACMVVSSFREPSRCSGSHQPRTGYPGRTRQHLRPRRKQDYRRARSSVRLRTGALPVFKGHKEDLPARTRAQGRTASIPPQAHPQSAIDWRPRPSCILNANRSAVYTFPRFPRIFLTSRMSCYRVST